MGIKAHRNNAMRSTSIVLVIAVNADGHREILGLRVAENPLGLDERPGDRARPPGDRASDPVPERARLVLGGRLRQ
ncbi:MAG: hypothetical protein ACREMD_03030 [Gemmatimonadota bacterium]